MNALNMLLANSIFLIAILSILISIHKSNHQTKPKLKEDIQKIKTQISLLE